MSRLSWSAVRKLGGFGSSTIANSMVGLITLPFIVTLAGPLAWGGIAVAQSVAGMAAILVAFGWGVIGPAKIASSRCEDRGRLYADSLVLRFLLLLLVLPLTGCVIAICAPGDTVADICAGAAMIVAAAGGSWFYVGEGKAWRLFTVDTIPRSVGTLAGTLLLAVTGEIALFAVAQLLGSLVSVSVAAVDILRRYSQGNRFRHSMALNRQIQSFKRQLPGVLTAAASSLYMNAPLAILAAVSPAAVPVYAIADKVTRFAVMAMSPLTQVAQSSVPSSNVEIQRRNIVLVTKLSAGGAVVSGLILAVAMPLGSQVLSAGKIEVPSVVSAGFGVALTAIVFSQVSGLVSLMALGQAKTVATIVVSGLCVAVPLVLVSASIWGAAGAAWSVGVSELSVALLQFRALRKALGKRELPGLPRHRSETIGANADQE